MQLEREIKREREGEKAEVAWREGAGEVWFLVPGLGSVICLSKTCLNSRAPLHVVNIDMTNKLAY